MRLAVCCGQNCVIVTQPDKPATRSDSQWRLVCIGRGWEFRLETSQSVRTVKRGRQIKA